MDWQPIDTAPKDGREIIAWGVRHGSWGYTDDQKVWTGIAWHRGNFETDPHWRETKCTPQCSNGFTPTHWIPLPEVPK